MDFQTSRAQFALDAAAASVLHAWENSQRHVPTPAAVHHPTRNAIHRPQLQLQYNNKFPMTPVTPSPSSYPMPMTGSNQWTPLTMNEIEMLQQLPMRRGVTVTPPAHQAIADRERHAPASRNDLDLFNFDFTLPNLPQLPSQRLQQQQRCSPTLPTPTTPSSSSTLFSSPPVTPLNPDNMTFRRESPVSGNNTKRSSDEGTTSTTAKKPRACATLKDFVPPDVTGLSKREARLVKNRAAAFLSRQRKREEFELMEIRVAELERENSRLRDMADGASPSPTSSPDSSELELLRMQLAASRQREVDLVHRLEALKHEQQKIKTEANEPTLSDGASSGPNSPVMSPNSPLKNVISNPKTGASLGLMVLLCALPSLLSQPSSHPRSTLSPSHSFLDTIQWDATSVYQASASATLDEIPSWELDFSGSHTGATTGNMDMDVDYGNVHSTRDEPEWQKLELGLEDGDNLGLGGLGLGSLDISFATTRTEDGKIRVRVHPPSTHPSKPERTSPTPDNLSNPVHMPAHSLPSPAQSHSSSTPESDPRVNPLSFSFVDTDPLGPFLGAGSSPMGTFELDPPFHFSSTGPNSGFMSGVTGLGGILGGVAAGQRRRVRIALRGLPQAGREGAEWEIEVR